MGWGDDYLNKTGTSSVSSWGDDYASYKATKANAKPYEITDEERQALRKSAYDRQWGAFRNELYPKLQSSLNAWKAQGGAETDFDWESTIGNVLAQEKYLDVARNFKRPAKEEEAPAGYDLVADLLKANKTENPNLFTPQDLITEYKNLTYQPVSIDPDRAAYSQENAQEQQERQRLSALDLQATANRIRELEALKQQTAAQTTIQAHGKALPTSKPGSEYDAEIARLTRDYGNAQRLKTLAGYDATRNEVGYAKFSGVPDVQFESNKNRELYNYINDIDGVRAEYSSRKYRPLGFMQIDQYEGYQHITDDEKKLYNYLLSTKGEDEAAKYLKVLEPDLNARYSGKLQANMGKFTKDVPVVSDAASVGIGFAKPQGEIYSLMAGLKGEQIDPNSPYFGPSIAQGSIRGTRSEQIKEGVGGFGGDALAFMYQTGMSIADFAAALPLGQTGALTLMGMNAATDATRDIVQRGGTNKQAIMGGLLAGAAEVVFEKVSIDSLVKMTNPAMRGAFIKNVLKQASIEASEEMLTEIANTISDGVVMGDLSNYNVAVKTYMQQGMSEADANAKAAGDVAANIGLAAAGGFLSGGVTGSFASSMNNTPEARAQAQQALNYEQTQQFSAAVQSVGLAPEAAQGVVKAYAQALQSGDTQGASKLQSTAKSTVAKVAELNLDLEIAQAEVIATLRPTFEAMQQAQQAGDLKAFLSAQAKYKADFDVGIAKNKAAKLKAENAMAAARDTIVSEAYSLQEQVNTAIIQAEQARQAREGSLQSGGNEQTVPQGRERQRDVGSLQTGSVRGLAEEQAPVNQPSGIADAGAYAPASGNQTGVAGSQASRVAAQATDTGAVRPGTGGNGSATAQNARVGGRSGVLEPQTVKWGTPHNERARQSIQRHMETAKRETGRAVVVREITEITPQLAKEMQNIKNIAGINSPDVFLYESDDSYGNGWKDATGIFIRVNGPMHPAYTYGHEVGHADPAIKAAGMAVIQKLPLAEIQAYAAYRDAHISSPDDADVKGEMVSDICGMYMQDVATEEEANSTLGLSPHTIQRFYDAFEQALGAQSGTGETEGEIVDVVSQYAATADPEYSRIGTDEQGRGIYRSSLPESMTYKQKQDYLLKLVTDVWAKKPITLYIGKEGIRQQITAKFDPTIAPRSDAAKIAYGNRMGTMRDQKTTIDLGPDLYAIAEESQYNYSKPETGKDHPAHQGIKQWYYFASEIMFQRDVNGKTITEPYTVSINVKDKGNEQYFYSFAAEKIKNPQDAGSLRGSETLHARRPSGGDSGTLPVHPSPNISIRDFAETSNQNSEYSRITFRDEYGIEHSLNMPEIKERSDGTYYVDFTLNGERKRMEGKNKAELEQRVREAKETQRLQTLSRSVRNLRKASDLFSRGVTVPQYFQQAGDNYDQGVARLLRGLYLRNGIAQGGALSEQDMLSMLANADKWKDKPALSYGRETLTRNLEDIASTPAEGRRLIDTYVAPIRKGVGDMTRWMKGWAERIGALDLNAEESAMVQLLGEGRVTPDVLLGGLKFENGKPMDTAKIKNAVETFRTFYNEALELANASLIRNGYEPIHARKNYFPHIGEEVGDWQGFVNKVIKGEEDLLPTAISGQTDIFVPGKPWFKNFQERYGEQTDYDAVRGFNQYMNGAGRVIFLTDSIQRIRQLEAAIRGKYSTGDPDSELKGAERAQHMSNFAAELLEYGNQLAGKKSRIDRAIEQAFGRPIFAKLDWLKKRFGANAIGGNLSPALTNFIPLTQALATLNKGDFARGMQAALSRQVRMDGLWETSNFLMSRFGKPDDIVTKPWEKFKQGAYRTTNYLFEMVDRFTSETLVFAKYQEGIHNGLAEDAAMRAADEYAERTMAGRSIGSVPTLMNSKTLGFITQFQLEVNNQMSAMFKDIPRSYGGDKRKFLKALVQLFIYSWLYNELMEKVVTGRRPAFDPIGVIVEAIEDYSTGKVGDATINLATNILDQLPFGQLLTGGGRVPLASALEGANPTDAIKKTLNGEDAGEAWGKFAEGVLYNFVPPAGGGQIRKTVGGIRDYAQGGRYYGDKLAYPIEQDGGNLIRAILFGSSSTTEGKAFYQGDAKALSADRTEKYGELVKQGMDPQEAYDFLKSVDTKTNAGTLADIATFDRDGDGKPDIELEEMNMVAAVLGIKMPKGKSVAQQAQAEANAYIEQKRKDKDLPPDKLQKAEDYYADLMRRLLN